jgi:hypothetical protein
VPSKRGNRGGESLFGPQRFPKGEDFVEAIRIANDSGEGLDSLGCVEDVHALRMRVIVHVRYSRSEIDGYPKKT